MMQLYYNKSKGKNDKQEKQAQQQAMDVFQIINIFASNNKTELIAKRDQIISFILEKFSCFTNLQKLLSSSNQSLLLKKLQYEHKLKYNEIFAYGEYGKQFFMILKGSVLVLVPKKRNKQQKEEEKEEQQQQKNEQQYTSPKKLLLLKDSFSYEKSELNSISNTKLMLDWKVKNYVKINYPNFRITNELFQNTCFGEIALIYPCKRSATLICNEDTDFLTLSKNDYNQLFGDFYIKQREEKISFIKSIDLFYDWKAYQMEAFSFEFNYHKFTRNEIVYKENDPGNICYFIVKGEVEISECITIKEQEDNEDSNYLQRNQQKRIKLGLFGPKQYFGLKEAMQKIPRQNQALCTQETEVF